MINRFIKLLTIFLFIFAIFAYPSKTFAQVPAITTIPCGWNAGALDEFHSLRPYQKNIMCTSDLSNEASYCGNDLTLKDIVTVYYPGSENYLYPNSGSGCITKNESVYCNYKVPVTKSVQINVSQAELPIMGNTQKVVNSQNSEESLSDVDKVNNYVSWYLNGTINKAEYAPLDMGKDCIGESTGVAGQCLNTAGNFCLSPNSIPLVPDLPDPLLKVDGSGGCINSKRCCVTINPLADKTTILDKDKIVNYSGPINKLLPEEILQQQRAQTVKNAVASKYTGAGISHDQVVACTYGIKIPILGTVIGGIPGPCYEKGLLSILPHAKLRLSDWALHLPPVRSNYRDYIDYDNALQTWRGKLCIEVKIPDIIPVLGGKGILLCFDDPGNLLNPNYYSTLYSYIPLSSTEDVKGEIRVDSVSTATNPTLNGVTVSDVKFSNQTPSTLFFPHMQEADQLGSLLQDTFAPKDADTLGSPTNIASQTSCNTVQVRSNAGDSLFANPITGNMSYTATFSCVYQAALKKDATTDCSKTSGGTASCYKGPWSCSTSYGASDCGGGYTCESGCSQITQECKKEVSISMSTTSKTPIVDNVWSRLVAGPMSVFKRIFPKTNTEGSVGQIMDIAGSTSISYQGTNISVSQSSTELKLPHIGGISEYFLKGIQTALRPKGYGESIAFASNSSGNSCTGGSMPALPAASGSCTISGSNGLPMTPTLKSIIESASQTFGVPPSLIMAVMYGEGDFNPGRYDWTEENVKAWSLSCASVPNCSPTTFPAQGVAPYFEADWNAVKDAVKVIDPNRDPNPCNLLDAIYALAKDLSKNQYGSAHFAGKTCYGIPLNSGTKTSTGCNWNASDYETAIRVWEFGTAYTDTITCATKPGSCFTGGGLATACDNGDNCERIGGSGNSSHNACLWNVAHNQ